MNMRPSRHWTLALVIGIAAIAGCEPKQPPPPEKPPAPPLADKQLAAPQGATGAAELPPGHPPIGDAGSVATPQPDQNPALPPGHPPIGKPAPTPATDNQGLPPGHPPIGQQPQQGQQMGAPRGDEKVDAPTQFQGIEMTPPEGWVAFDPGAGQAGFSPPVAVFELPAAEGDAQGAEVRLTYFPGMRSIPLEANLNRWYGQVGQPDGRPSSEVAEKQTFESDGVTVTLVDIPGNVGGQENWRMMAAVIEHPQGPHFLTVKGPDSTMRQWKESVVEYLKSAKVTP